MSLADDDVYTLEADSWNGLAVETLRFTGKGDGYTTGGGDTPPNTLYKPRLNHALMLARTAFADRKTSGRAEPAAGEVELWNQDGGLDYLRGYVFDGRSAVMRRGQTSGAYPSTWTKTLNGTMRTPTWTRDGIRLDIRDAQAYASVVLQSTFYAGTNTPPSGLEGTAGDIKGKPKPVLIGTVRNLSPVLVNADKLIYQFHDAAAAAVAMVYAGGLPLSEGMTWTSRNPGFTGQAAHGCAIADDGTMVTVGSPGDGASSVDGGATWTHYTITGGGQLNKVHWAAGLFIAVGDNNQIFSSATGLTGSWTLRTSVSAGQTLTDVTYGLVAGVGTWLVVGLAGLTRTSTNGTTWSNNTTVGAPTNLNGVAYGTSNNTPLFVAAGDGGTIYTTPDATTWTTRTSASATNNNHVDYGNGVWVMVGASGGVQRSLDGITWTTVPSLVSVNISALRYGNGRWLYGSANGDLVTSLNGGQTWTALTLAISGPPNIQAIAYGNNTFLLSGSVNFAATSDPLGRLYANSTDLQDDTKAPAPGTFKTFLDAAGSYIRLGFLLPGDRVTMDASEGATSANRTIAQCWARVQQRAGLAAGSGVGKYSSADLTAMDALDGSEVGFYAGPDDAGLLCIDVADKFAQTGGCWSAPDGGGTLRLQRLTAAAPNLVTNPDDLATAPWGHTGTAAATNAVGRYSGRSFSRITGATAGDLAQPVTLPADGTYYIVAWFKKDANTGTTPFHLYDNTSSAFRIQLTITIASDGSMTAVATTGSLVRIVQMPGPDNVWAVVAKGTGCVAAHTNSVYVANSFSAASVLVSNVTVLQNDPVATIAETDLFGDPQPVVSGDENDGIPPHRSVLRWGRNYTVMSNTDLAGGVSDSERARLTAEWREAASSDTGVLTAHPFSLPATIETLYTVEANAQTEANRRQTLFGADRQWLEVTVKMTTAFAAIELGDVIEVVYYRYLLGAGGRFRVLGIKPEASEGNQTYITFTLWR